MCRGINKYLQYYHYGTYYLNFKIIDFFFKNIDKYLLYIELFVV